MKKKNEKLTMAISQRLKLARRNAGFRSARAFALKHDIPIQTYLNHESGKRGLSISVALEYCALLNVSFTWLATGEEEKQLCEAE